jgi:hypothetical protein
MSYTLGDLSTEGDGKIAPFHVKERNRRRAAFFFNVGTNMEVS